MRRNLNPLPDHLRASVSSRTVAIHQPEFLPWLGFFDKLRQADVFVLLDHVQFEKDYFQNRNRIRTPTAQGWSWLTVPVLTKGRFGQAICDVEINERVEWRRKHLTAIHLSYQRAPYFSEFSGLLARTLSEPWQRLADLNIAAIETLARCFGLQRPILRSSLLGVSGARSALLLDICQRTGATEYLSGISGRDYLDIRLFADAGIAVRFQEFLHPKYPQQYLPFVPAMSSLDMLFNCGRSSMDMLTDPDAERLAAPLQ